MAGKLSGCYNTAGHISSVCSGYMFGHILCISSRYPSWFNAFIGFTSIMSFPLSYGHLGNSRVSPNQYESEGRFAFAMKMKGNLKSDWVIFGPCFH